MPTRIATITLNPAIDQTAFVPGFAPGEVNRVQSEQSDPGGKGVNVASFLADFGYEVAVSGFLGRENEQIFRDFFAAKKIEDRFVRTPGKTRVNIKVVDPDPKKITDINFAGPTVTHENVFALKQEIESLAENCIWFVLSGSIPSGVPAQIYKDVISGLKARGKTVVLDASGEPLAQALPAAPHFVKPNIHELQDLLGTELETERDIVHAARELLAGGIQCVAVSMGPRGAIFVEAEEALLANPLKVEVRSTVGAGDAMVAGIVTGKLRAYSLADCARLATAFAAGALTQLGPRLPAANEIESMMKQVTVRTL